MATKKSKFDDLTLMQFADGELDSKIAAEIKEAIKTDSELRQRVSMFFDLNVDINFARNGVPSDLEKIIKSKTKKQITKKINIWNMLFGTSTSGMSGVVKANPAIAIGVAFAIGGAVGISGSMFSSKGPQSFEYSPQEVIYSSMSDKKEDKKENLSKAQSDKFAIRFLSSLVKSPNEESIKFEDGNIQIISSFKNLNGDDCKIAEYKDNLLIACQKDSKWQLIN